MVLEMLTCDKIGATGRAVDYVLARIKNKWRDLLSFLTTRVLLLGAKGKWYSAFSVTLYSRETWPVKEYNVIWLERWCEDA